jgi:hypothetical protein
MSQLLVQGKVHAFLKKMQYLPEKVKGSFGRVARKHAAFDIAERRQNGEKAVWRAERARFLDRKERGAKPETELLLPRWGKSSVPSSHSA